MRNLMLSVLSLGAVALLVGDASAFGFRKKKKECCEPIAAPVSYGCGGCGGGYGGMPYHADSGNYGSPYAAMPAATGTTTDPRPTTGSGVVTASGTTTTTPSGVTQGAYAVPAGAQPSMVYPAGYNGTANYGTPYTTTGMYQGGTYNGYNGNAYYGNNSGNQGRNRMMGGWRNR